MFQFVCSFLVILLLALSARADTTLTTCTEATLRTALANGGIIQLNCSSNIIRLTQPLVVTENATLTTTNGAMVISGDNVTRLFVVNPGVELTISNIALFSGRHTDTNLNDGGIPDTAGACIYNNGGTVRIVKGTVSSHVVIGTTGGPGEEGREGENGDSGGDAAGAGIYNREGTVVLSNVVFSANRATGGVGGIGGAGGAAGFGGDGGDGGNGGSAGGAAVYSQGGVLEIYSCVFTNNQTVGALAGEAGLGSGFLGFHGQPGIAGDAVGGAVAGDSTASVIISASTFINNSVTAATGNDSPPGLRNQEGSNGRPGGNAAGGAVYTTGILRMTNCTLNANSATGGNGGAGGAGGSTGFGSDGGDGGNGGHATGGALDASGSAQVVNSTFADNTLTAGQPGTGGAGTGVGDAGDAGAPGLALGGSVVNSSGTLALANTIVANSTPANVGGIITDLGGNLSTDASALFTHGDSAMLVDPLLRPLAANGGPTPTMALSTNSPALNKGLTQFCPPTDQRGSNRWHQCDIGAFEFNGGILVTPTNVSVSIGGSILTTNLTNAIAISWPTNSPNLKLFAATNLPTTNWTAVTGLTVITVGSSNVARIPVANVSQRYFRLTESFAEEPTGPPIPGGGGPPIPQ